MADPMVAGGDGWISDDSEFYGDEQVRSQLEMELESIPTARFWKIQSSLPAVIAWHNRKLDDAGQHGTYFHNPMEGVASARQSGESIDEFLTRLPPSSTTALPGIPFIWCMNPRIEPPKKRANLQGLLEKGGQLLDDFAQFKTLAEHEARGRRNSAISKKIAVQRSRLEGDIKAAAVEHGCTQGKWMLFQDAQAVEKLWREVAEQTWRGNLGVGAKVATGATAKTKDSSADTRLICIYTRDFTDTKDVRRVLEALARMGFLHDAGGKSKWKNGIWYKCDAYTYLNIESGNPYGLRASSYGSKEMMGA